MDSESCRNEIRFLSNFEKLYFHRYLTDSQNFRFSWELCVSIFLFHTQNSHPVTVTMHPDANPTLSHRKSHRIWRDLYWVILHRIWIFESSIWRERQLQVHKYNFQFLLNLMDDRPALAVVDTNVSPPDDEKYGDWVDIVVLCWKQYRFYEAYV